jgi:hypothetical protein
MQNPWIKSKLVVKRFKSWNGLTYMPKSQNFLDPCLEKP